MSTCTVFVFLSLMEYALVNIYLGDFVETGDSYLRRGVRGLSAKLSIKKPRKSLRKEPERMVS